MKRCKEVQKRLFLQYLSYIKDVRLYRKDLRIKKQAAYFFKGIDGAKRLRVEIQKEKDVGKIIEKVKNF